MYCYSFEFLRWSLRALADHHHIKTANFENYADETQQDIAHF